jgi:hypothetical protein
MATIFDFQHTQRPGSIRNGIFVLPDQENISIRAEIFDIALHMYFRLMATMFEIPVTPMSESMHTVLLDPENVGVEPLEFRCCVVWKVGYCVISFVLPVMAAIFDLPHIMVSDSVHVSPNDLLAHENVCEDYGFSLFISHIETMKV